MGRMWAAASLALALGACGGGAGIEQDVAAAAAVERPRVQLPGVSFQPPAGWVAERPASSARVAEYRLPGVVAGDASLVVYYFGADGAGTTESNIDRWCGQFEQPEGQPSRDAATVEAKEINGLAVTTLDLAGTYVAETAPGSGVRVNEPGWRLLAAVVATGAGPYYVKLVGPDQCVARWKSSYRKFLESLRPGAASGAEGTGASHP